MFTHNYYILTIQRDNNPLETIFYEGTLISFALFEKRLGRETKILFSKEITKEEYEQGFNQTIKKEKNYFTEEDIFEMFKKLVVRGCFRGTESKPNRNYEIAVQTLKEMCYIDYEKKVDESM